MNCKVRKLVGDSRTGKWWEEVDKKGKANKRWTTLYHNGIYFPEEYTPLPSKAKFYYDGKPVELDSKNTKNPFNVSAEEAAIFFAQMVDRDERLKNNKKRHRYSEDEVFRKNFWTDWKVILGKNSPIKNFDKVDFTKVAKYLLKKSDDKKEEKKSLSKEEKEEIKQKKQKIKEIYGYAVIDGNKIEMDYTVEPPGLYQGHGKHPLRGKIKKRLIPKDITINVSKDGIPACYNNGKECKWGSIIEDHDVTWIASWKHPITSQPTYKWLKRTESHFVCAGDMEKFDKASKLAKNIENIRKKYKKDLKSSAYDKRQLATAVYLLDVLAIRPGTEKDEAKEAGTLGLTTLKCSNVNFLADDKITVDFTGKSSIQFNKTFTVDHDVYKNLQESCKKKTKNNALFPDINASTLNGYLKTILPELTAKVFRTWKASSILQEELFKKIPKETESIHTKQIAYNKVNIKVAKALNHKKMTDNDDKVKKIEDKIKELKKKQKDSTTEKQKASAKKSLETQAAKLEEAKHNIALGTSKLNYLDPRISVVWAKKSGTPIEKIYNKTQLKKFVWAMDAGLDWRF